MSENGLDKAELLRNLSSADRERLIRVLAEYLYKKELQQKKLEKLMKL